MKKLFNSHDFTMLTEECVDTFNRLEETRMALSRLVKPEKPYGKTPASNLFFARELTSFYESYYILRSCEESLHKALDEKKTYLLDFLPTFNRWFLVLNENYAVAKLRSDKKRGPLLIITDQTNSLVDPWDSFYSRYAGGNLLDSLT